MGHKNTFFNLKNGLNVIIGLNDSGKSSLIRAVRWVAGLVDGDDYIYNNGEDKATSCEVTIETDKGTVGKKRNSKGTFYYLNNIEVKTAKFTEEAQAILNIQPEKEISGCKFNLNFVSQHDSLFLLSETPSTGAAILGEIANTKSVDKVFKNLEKSVYNYRKDINFKEGLINKINVDLLSYLMVPGQLKQAEEIEQLALDTETLDTKIASLTSLFNAYKEAKDTVAKEQQNIDRYAQYCIPLKDCSEVEQLTDLFEKHIQLVSNTLLYSKDIEKYTAVSSISLMSPERLTSLSDVLKKYKSSLMISEKNKNIVDQIIPNLDADKFDNFIWLKSLKKAYILQNNLVNSNKNIVDQFIPDLKRDSYTLLDNLVSFYNDYTLARKCVDLQPVNVKNADMELKELYGKQDAERRKLVLTCDNCGHEISADMFYN